MDNKFTPEVELKLLPKKFHQWLFLLVCFVCTLPSWARDYTRDGIIYDINTSTKTATVKGVVDECITSAEIVSYVAECKVTSIGDGAFSYCSSLTSINIPSSVTSIGDGVFSYCSSLTSINIPSSVISIGEYAFKCCSSLSSINIPSSVTSIERYAFFECSSLTSLNIPNSVKSIGNGVFSYCSSLASINIPNSVTSIGRAAFSGCSSLTTLTVDGSNPNYCVEGSMLFNKEKSTLICAFGSQKTYDIPSSVTSIGNDAFEYCSSLTSTNIPNTVKSIGLGAFKDCSSLTSINIPSSVTSIGSAAFSGCSSLTTFTVDANNPNYCIEESMLFNKEKSTLVCAVGNQKTYNIPSSVNSIEEYAFWGCSSLTSINIPITVTSIGRCTFYKCSSLTSINIPSSVTSIGQSAFMGCSALTSINIPNSVTSIENGAFSNCDALKVVLLQSERIEFGGYVFRWNTNIYAVSNNNLDIHLDNNYKPNVYSYVNDYIGGRWFTYGTPDIYDYNGSAISSDKWSGIVLDYITVQYLKTIFQTCTNAQIFISNNKVIYNKISENLRKNLEDNLNKIDDLANIIAEGDAALSDLSTNLSNAYNDVRNAVQLDMNDNLNKLYAEAKKIIPSFDNTYAYSPLLPAYTAGSNILTSANQLSTNKPESEGPISNLVDGDKNTFFHSTWSAKNEDNAFAYLQIDLKGSYKDLLLDYTKRYNFTGNKGYPTQFHVFATNTPNDEESWKDCGYSNQLSYRYDNQQSGKTILNLDGDYQYIRLQVEKTGGMEQTNGNLYFALGELAIYPVTNYKNAPYTEKDGLITDASQLSSNAIEPQEGSLAELIDNDITTYFHSTWSQNNATGAKHYLQVDLNDAYKQIALKYSKRQVEVDNGSPVTLRIYATNTPEGEYSWTDLGTQTCAYDYDFGNTGLLPLNFGDAAYRHIRLTVEETTGNSQLNGNLFFYWSELHAYTRASQADKLTEATRTALTTAMQQAKAELDAEYATSATYEALQSAYNAAKNEVGEGSRLVDFAKSFYLTAYSDQALVVPTGVKAAVVTANGEGIRNDYRYNSGDVIPAGTGVLLKGGKGNSFYLSASESTEMAPEDNLLHGTLTDEMTNVAGADKYYKLSYDRATGTEIGFYWGAANGGAFMNKGGKAFLAIPATLQAAQLTGFSLFDLDNNQAITGIEHATATPAATLRVYDLNGRRINVNRVDELPQGIYVINGKKVIR